MSALNNYFRFGDHASTEFSLYISGEGTFNAPARDYQSIKVLGRNGNLIIDNGRFENGTVTYPAFLIGNRQKFNYMTDSIRAWLHEKTGYQALMDSYHPDEYRMGIYSGDFNVDVKALNVAGTAKLKFEVMPQRFLFSGLNEYQIDPGYSISLVNPSSFDALPLINVFGTGSGEVMIGNQVIEIINNNQNKLIIDCELQEAYAEGAVNMNSHIGFMNSFPVLPEGETGISFTGDFTAVTIIPRWWRL